MKTRIIGAAGTAALLAGATLASGAALKEKSVEFSVAGGATSDETAQCKKKQTAVAGGFETEIDLAPGADVGVLAVESTRTGKRGWTLAAGNIGANPGDATAYVYCDKRKRKLSKVTTDETVSNNNVGDAEVRCAKGTAVSGGFEASSSNVVPITSKRDGKKEWEVEVGNANPSSIELDVFVYCDKRKRKIKTKTASTTVAEQTSESVRAKCSKKQQLVSGGYENQFDLGSNTGNAAHGSHRVGKRKWEHDAFGVAGNPEATVYAYCEKKKKKKGRK